MTLASDNIPADTGEVGKLLTATVELKAKAFPTEDATNLTQYGLNPPAIKVSLTRNERQIPRLLLDGEGKRLRSTQNEMTKKMSTRSTKTPLTNSIELKMRIVLLNSPTSIVLRSTT